jgi:probable rRNA maturation factor
MVPPPEEGPAGAGALVLHLNAPHGHRVPQALLRRGLETLWAREGVAGGELSVTFLTDGPMRELNRRYLGHDRVTDVLAFALHEEGEAPIGDVYVGVEQGERQARDHGVERDEELLRLALHGALHVLGYDHPEAAEEREGSEQYRRQEEMVREVLSP